MTPAEQTRRLAWSWFALCALAFAATAVFSGPAREWVLALAVLPVPVACLAAARMSRGTERHFWLLTAVTGLVVLLGRAYDAWLGATALGAGTSPAILLDLTAVGLFGLTLLLLGWEHEAASLGWWRRVADAIGIVVAGFSVALVYVVRPLFAASPAVGLPSMVLVALCPALGVVLVLGTVNNVGAYTGKRQPWERLAVPALVAVGIGVSAWPLGYAASIGMLPPAAALVPEAIRLAGRGLLTVAAVYRITDPRSGWPLQRQSPSEKAVRLRRVMGPLAPVVSLAAVAALAFRAQTVPASEELALLAAYIVGAVALVQLALLGIEKLLLGDDALGDTLTGLPGHRQFQERLEMELDLGERYGEQVGVAVLDLDRFQRVNEAYGHGVGDEVLRRTSSVLRDDCRADDILGRLGGDRFGVIMPGVSPAEARERADVLRRAIRAAAPKSGELTASVGVAVGAGGREARAELLRDAEGACYWAKCHGRDHTVLYDPAVVHELTPDERLMLLQDRARYEPATALAALLEARGLRAHGERVGRLAATLATDLGLGPARAELIGVAGLLHDIGHVGSNEGVTSRSGPRTAADREQLLLHPVLSERILSASPYAEVLPWVRGHHECWDGGGFPDGLTGEDIPLEARILRICDYFDSLTLRGDRRLMSDGAALQQLDLELGVTLDPELGDRFIRLVNRELTERGA